MRSEWRRRRRSAIKTSHLELQDRYLPLITEAKDQIGLRRLILDSRFSLAIEFEASFCEGFEIFVERDELGFEDTFHRALHFTGLYALCRDQDRLEVALPYVEEMLQEVEKAFITEPEMYSDFCENFRSYHAKIIEKLGSDQ